MTTPAGRSEERRVQWQLFVADPSDGEVVRIVELGECSEPVDSEGRHARTCDEQSLSVTWMPDGEHLTVLADGSLTTYDVNGKDLGSEPTSIRGPIVWMPTR